ncbi:autorepressor SdpR family transcription factor [Anaerosporobacter sp.]|uniref:autorepressor SdpR family transcription factor n=1 Tax=Anaerosporobacter sp. TaxID=1872529 RepID=UPI00286F7D25|nr:autorepressor SdpR family transcription factor [Anaerosporobacter sp.]
MAISDTFKALNDPVRCEIITILKKGRMSVGEILEHFNVTGATMSYHLNILKNAGLVSDVKKGKYIYYELNISVVEEIMTWFIRLKEDYDEQDNK